MIEPVMDGHSCPVDSTARPIWQQDAVVGPLRAIARRTLAPFGAADGARGRFAISGDDVQIRPKPALAIAMGLHELATNAVKHGALSAEGGTVDLDWKTVADDVLLLRWAERGGPSVSAPGPTGSGRRQIERGLARDLAGTARIDFRPEGVVCEIGLPRETALVATTKRKAG